MLSHYEARTSASVALTAESSSDLYERCAARGTSDFFHKPIAVSEMTDFIEARVIMNLQPGVWRKQKPSIDCAVRQAAVG